MTKIELNCKQLSIPARIAYGNTIQHLLAIKNNVSRETLEFKYLTEMYWLIVSVQVYDTDIISIPFYSTYDYVVDVVENEKIETFTIDTEYQILGKYSRNINYDNLNIIIPSPKCTSLYNYYHSIPKSIVNGFTILANMVEFGLDAGGEGDSDSAGTMFYLNELLEIAKTENINLPDFEPFLYSTYSQNHGYGVPISIQELRKYFHFL